MKKKILAICLVAVLALAAIGGTLAYFTDNEQAVNVFTFGDIDIELDEPLWDEPDTVLPGIKYDKDPYVKNVGDNDAWIRIDVTLSDAAAFQQAAANHGITNLATIFEVASDFDTKWVLAGEPVYSDITDSLTYSYYYKTILAPDAETTRLFTAVTIPKQFNNAEMEAIGPDFTITVTAHGMQDAGFANVQAAFAEYVYEAKPANP